MVPVGLGRLGFSNCRSERRPCPGHAGFAGACIGMHAAWTRPALVAGGGGPRVPLHLAEGAYGRGGNRHARYQSAAASAREALARLETAEALGWVAPLEPELGALFQRVIGTLARLCRPRR
jgi:hypothetical protein